jgi:hypothetical protein
MCELTIYRSDGYGGNEYVELDIDIIRTSIESIHYRPKLCNKWYNAVNNVPSQNTRIITI